MYADNEETTPPNIREQAKGVISVASALIKGGNRVEDLVFLNAKGRLAHTILQLAQKFGHTDKERTVLPIRFSQKELATLIGTSRPTVNITMGQLEAEGLIGKQDGFITIENPDALRRIINTR